jgi:hypothetical protein
MLHLSRPGYLRDLFARSCWEFGIAGVVIAGELTLGVLHSIALGVVLSLLLLIYVASHPKANRSLQEIWMAETSKDAEVAFDAFIPAYRLKYDKAAECLAKDHQALLAFYDFPAKHLRTSNPIESTFATSVTARSARRAASRIRRRSRWYSSSSMRHKKPGEDSMATTSCPSSFKVSGSPTESKSSINLRLEP